MCVCDGKSAVEGGGQVFGGEGYVAGKKKGPGVVNTGGFRGEVKNRLHSASRSKKNKSKGRKKAIKIARPTRR